MYAGFDFTVIGLCFVLYFDAVFKGETLPNLFVDLKGDRIGDLAFFSASSILLLFCFLGDYTFF